MAASQDIKALVSRIPDPDRRGTYADLDAGKVEQIRKVVGELRRGGRGSLIGLIDLLVEPGKGDDTKAHFALHLLAVDVTAEFDGKARAAFARTLASQLAADRPKGVRKYLIEQLQVAGGREVVKALGEALLDPDLCDPAARALAAIRDGAVEVLLAALPKVKGPGRLSVIQNLAVLRAERAAKAFREALDDPSRDVRIAAAWGIARIADASAAEALLKTADAHAGWERTNETDACMVLAENLAAAGRKREAAGIYAHLQKTRTEASDSHIRQAAALGLGAGT